MALKVLVAYTYAGAGHRRAAEAVYNYLKANYKECDISIVDSLEFTNFLFRNIYAKGYSYTVSQFPFFWNLAYRFTCNDNLMAFNRIARYLNQWSR